MSEQVQLKAADDDFKGRYANMLSIHATPEEFVLDFFSVFPPAGILVSRVVVSPGHLKRMIQVLSDTLATQEQQFKKIDPAEEPKPIGFDTTQQRNERQK